MKIVCDSCGAKYSIADEKVQGKVFKIRCKKCSNVIVVKGTEEAAAGDYGGAAAEWYAVIDGDQVGPVPSVEIDSYYMAGKIDADSFVWRDGLSDWVAISTLPDFAHLTQHDVAGPDDATQIAESPSFADDVDDTAVASLGAGVAAGADSSAFGGGGDETINAGVSNDFGGGSDAFGGSDDGFSAGNLGGDDYGADSDDYGYAAGGMDDGGYDSGEADDSGYGGFSAGGDYGAGMETSEPGGDDGGGMFAAFDSGDSDDDGSDFMSFGGGADSGAAPNNGAGGGGGGGIMSQNDMVGQRNENSVLFSLSSLDQVSAVSGDTGGGGPAAGGGGMPSPGGAGPVTEGSGLIDIRALASAHESMKGSGGDADDGLDPFAHGTMSMPALMPMGSHRSNKPLIIGAVIGGILFLGLVGVVIALTLGGGDKKEGGEQVIVKEIIREVAVAAEDGKAEEDEKEKNAAEAAAKAAEEEAEAGNAESDTEEAEEKKTAEKAPASKSSSKSSPPKSSASAVAPKSSSKGKDGIDKLIGNLDKKEDSKSADDSKSGSSGLKSKLGKSDVLGTIKRYQGRVHTCHTSHNGKKLSGTMKVKFYIKPSGRVTNTSVVTSKFKGSDVGGCVERVVRGMKFPATSASKNVPVTYPFIMK
jgi:predicted Zn finger-like uncharacterized protein